jgi:hypothetical protein
VKESDLLREIQQARQLAPKVVYVEGPSDVPVLFALIGIPQPPLDVHGGVVVRRLSGREDVQVCVDLARRHGYPGVHGIVDGDGESFATLAPSFAPPFAGPCFHWPSYSVENMLAKTGWPAAWGPAPDWTQVLVDHLPYVALNRLREQINRSLKLLQLARYNKPVIHEPLKTRGEVVEALAQAKGLLQDYDVAARFQQEVEAAEATVRGSLDEGHALVDGKWLLDAFAPTKLGRSFTGQRCRDEWIAHAVSVGGLPEVRDLWRRIAGRPP